MPRIKRDQCKDDKELQNDDDMRGVHCKNGIKHLAMFGAEGERCAAMPHRLPKEESQQRVLIKGGG
jgi:hypothetical protein